MTREHAVLAAVEGPVLEALGLVRGEVGHEVAGHADVEEENPAGPGERERLVGPQELHERRLRRRGRRRLGERGRRGRRPRRRSGGPGFLRLELLHALVQLLHPALVLLPHRVELLAHLLKLSPEALRLLGLRQAGREETAGDKQGHPSTARSFPHVRLLRVRPEWTETPRRRGDRRGYRQTDGRLG